MAEVETSLHIVMLPWLAMGHLIPFHNLSLTLALKGHKVSFISTPKNLQRLPQTLTPLLTLHPFSLPLLPNRDGSLLPPHAESSMDIPYPKHQLLKAAFDLLEPQIKSFLESSKPDWVVFDFTAHWLPKIATQLGIKATFFSLFSASLLCFFGPPGSYSTTPTIDDFVNVPKWVPFETKIVFRPHEVTKYMDRAEEYDSVVTPDTVRFGGSVVDCEMVAVRTCVEFEPEWIDLLRRLYKKPVVPVGVLPPVVLESDDEEWVQVRGWLDEQSASSVVYVALGSEAILSREEIKELALGLETTGLPFFWVLRDPPASNLNALAMLPHGFLERVEGRGMVCTKWAPQARILSHDSVGGFLTHCGCNSYIEGLANGRVLILLPFINDQGLNARQLEGKKYGVEVCRDEKDGSFSCKSVAEAVLVAMVDESGESIRDSAKEAKGVFGDLEKNDKYVDDFIAYLVQHKKEHVIC